jgi:carbonic anhydrase/acetyltransferase-like protein (isoleucine patch superfamily)
MAPVVIGEETNIQDGCVIHVDTNRPCVIGDRVTVGHGAVLHGCRIQDDVMVGIRATVLNDAQIGSGSVIGAGALIPEGAIIPNDSLVLGVPGKIVGPVSPELKARVLRGAKHYVNAARVYKSLDPIVQIEVADPASSAECISEDLG